MATRLPFQRSYSALAKFERCRPCEAEYRDPANRHHLTETIACPKCGPRALLIRFDGGPVNFEQHFVLDDVDAACSLIQKGEVVAIKSIGGYQLACDATNAAAVIRLRRAKQNPTKPLPVMARDLHVISRFCAISFEEEVQLTSDRGPIVILRASGRERLPDEVAPGLATLGFMLPTTALHLLLLQRMSRPVVMTSGNLSGEPCILDDNEARQKLGVAVGYALVHDQPIVSRMDDSVVRVMDGKPRILRRARGYTPSALRLPSGFERASDPLAVGRDRDTMFALVDHGEVILSSHYGALREESDCADYRDAICHYRHFHNYNMSAIALDPSPLSFASHLAREYALSWHLRLIDVEPEHAQIAACLAENNHALDAPPALGVVLDLASVNEQPMPGGGDILLADYQDWRRLGALKPVIMPARAPAQPWRSLLAHLMSAMGWREFAKNHRDLEVFAWLEGRTGGPPGIESMNSAGIATSSCGLLFDAVAAALDLCRERQSFDGEAAMQLEALADLATLESDDPERQYAVVIGKMRNPALPVIDPAGMWSDLLRDRARNTPAPVIAARFHRWLAASVLAMAQRLVGRDRDARPRTPVVALSGGCFQNRILLETTAALLRKDGFTVLTHSQVPPHEGALALGQAVVGAALMLAEAKQPA